MVYPHLYRTEHSETITTNSMYGEYYRRNVSKKVPIQSELLEILHFVDSSRDDFLKDVTEAVAIKSISGKIKYRQEVIQMVKYVEHWLTKLNIKYECFNVGFHVLDDGKEYRLPPIIAAELGRDSNKKTVCVYCHIDVNDRNLSEWVTDPWKVEIRQKTMYGNSVSFGKGALLGWFYVVMGFQQSDIELPVNLKFCIESMYHQENKGLEGFLAVRRQDFFSNVDCFVMIGSEWLGNKIPCLCYGAVGILHFNMTIEKTESSNTEITEDIEKIFKTIRDDENTIIVPKFNDFVEQITPDEEKLYEPLDFDINEIRDSLPEHQRQWDKVNLLMHFWRLPSIYVGDVEECICDKKDFSKIKRHFIIKIVPRQTVDKSVSSVIKHVEKIVKQLNIQNKVTTECFSSSRPWRENYMSPAYEAARRANIQIYKEDPNMIREDGDRKVLTMIQRNFEKNLLLLPIGSKGLNSAQPNENIPLRNMFEGIKVMAAFLFQYALTK